MQRHRLFGHRRAKPLDLLARIGQLDLLRGLATPSGFGCRQRVQSTLLGGLAHLRDPCVTVDRSTWYFSAASRWVA